MTERPAPAADISAADRLTIAFIKDLTAIIRSLTGWRVWHSDSGTLYATRVADLTDAEMGANLNRTLAADTPYALVDLMKAELQKSADLAEAKAAEAAKKAKEAEAEAEVGAAVEAKETASVPTGSS